MIQRLLRRRTPEVVEPVHLSSPARKIATTLRSNLPHKFIAAKSLMYLRSLRLPRLSLPKSHLSRLPRKTMSSSRCNNLSKMTSKKKSRILLLYLKKMKMWRSKMMTRKTKKKNPNKKRKKNKVTRIRKHFKTYR